VCSQHQLGLAHWTVRWCTARLVNGEVVDLGNRRSCTAIIHRTVRRCTRLSGESSVTNSPLSGYGKSDVAIIHRTVRWWTGLSGEPTVASANGRPRTQSAGDTWTAPTVSWCTGLSGVPTGPEEQRSDAPDLEGDRAPDMNIGCLVHHSTEDRNCLPRLSPTAPNCLGAIKGTPRRMEESTKLTRNILRHLDYAFTQSDHRS
jgi:hypothetical protein